VPSQLGVSNFPPDLLQKFIEICNQHGYVKPTVYQGQYNLVSRESEDTLFPLLRKKQDGVQRVQVLLSSSIFMRSFFDNTFSPLAGGFLTGRLTAGDVDGTRFAATPNSPLRTKYDKQGYHKVISDLQALLGPHGITLPEATLRWLRYHSALKEGDGILLGASRTSQLERNVGDIGYGPLADDIVVGMEMIVQGLLLSVYVTWSHYACACGLFASLACTVSMV
jgi:aflatoxin B1 aldehyde reductase